MANLPPAVPPPVAPLPPGYWFAHCDYGDQEEAMKEGRERVALEFKEQVELGVKTYAKPETDTAKLSMAFRRKPVFLWVGQRVYFPWMFERDWKHWERIDPDPVAVDLRASIIDEVEAQSQALTRQLLLQEAQARAVPPAPAAPVGPQGDVNVQQPAQPPAAPPTAA